MESASGAGERIALVRIKRKATDSAADTLRVPPARVLLLGPACNFELWSFTELSSNARSEPCCVRCDSL